jgi:hypothetical protein
LKIVVLKVIDKKNNKIYTIKYKIQ